MSTVRAARAAIRTNDRFHRGAVALAMGGILLMSAACGDGQGKGADTAAADRPAGTPSGGAAPAASPAAPAAPRTSAAVLDVEPKDGAQAVAPTALQVTVSHGKLTTVDVTDKDGKPVQGSITPDGTGWKPAAALAPGTTYTVNAQAKDADGLVSAATSAFTTVSPGKQVSTNDNIADGQTYGVGMIVKVDFSSRIVNKDAVAKAITFETSDGTEVKGHWFGDDRIDFRPAQYWKPDTRVTIHYRLKNVEVAPGVWGDVDKDEPFVIGRSQISTADAATHLMTTVRDGKSTTVPATLGDDKHPSWGGTMVIMSKEKVTHMNSQTVGLGSEYDIPAAPHAMRLTRSGTYLHGNYWYKGDPFGTANTSHGCVSLKDVEGGSDTSPAGSFFNGSLIGDIVTIVNTKEKTVAPDNGLGGWNLLWVNW
ncbi:Ig-like domain-containing protein [Streptomyces sp. SP17BM10]|uniref:L,D-transpeptidase n=1 Tax=Streptomyces sp. SP17BM10 TaxID=3002530 RepID=UPI002E770A8C|nr:Ig-like domain-containing protein [Streptomyces sp. SP17BM10]MEE1783769.1 Ig-like domain-containing protein [Streptomyces sp. SP17BM10]